MKFVFLILSFALSNAFGQSCQTNEVRISYTNGIEVFNICINNPQVSFNEKKEYFWYYDISGSPEIKSTQGGCGGNLLHGKEQFFDSKGNLRFERNYNLGLFNGESKYWDSATGRLNEIYKHENGSLTYRKQKIDGGWFEEIGVPLSNGNTIKKYDDYSNLITESVFKNNNYLTKEYYRYSKKLKVEYSNRWWCDTCLNGKFVSYYQNGSKKEEGLYHDSFNSVKVGIWKWYKQTGEIDSKEAYKAKVYDFDVEVK